MTSKLTATSDTDVGRRTGLGSSVRLVGAAVAAAIAIVNLGVAFARQDALGLERLIGVAGVVLAPGIGWFLAHRVLRGGRRAIVVAGLQFALVGTLVGALVTALLFVATSPSPIGVQSISWVFQWAVAGLVFMGPGMFGLIFALALVWGGIVRTLASLLQHEAS